MFRFPHRQSVGLMRRASVQVAVLTNSSTGARERPRRCRSCPDCRGSATRSDAARACPNDAVRTPECIEPEQRSVVGAPRKDVLLIDRFRAVDIHLVLVVCVHRHDREGRGHLFHVVYARLILICPPELRQQQATRRVLLRTVRPNCTHTPRSTRSCCTGWRPVRGLRATARPPAHPHAMNAGVWAACTIAARLTVLRSEGLSPGFISSSPSLSTSRSRAAVSGRAGGGGLGVPR